MAAVQYLLYVGVRNALVWVFLVDYSMVLLMAVLMNQYHLSLILRNLTTNEDMNRHRYHYLKDDLNKYVNPFSSGPWGNFAECFGRRSAVLADPYVHTELYEKFRRQKPDVEMAEMQPASDGEESERLTPAHGHSHGHSHHHG